MQLQANAADDADAFAEVDRRMARRITGDEYDKKARELKERQTEITLRIEQHQKGEGDYRATLETLISLASRPNLRLRNGKTISCCGILGRRYQ